MEGLCESLPRISILIVQTDLFLVVENERMGGTIPGAITKSGVGDVLHQLCQFITTHNCGGVEGIEFFEDSLGVFVDGVGPSDLSTFVSEEGF